MIFGIYSPLSIIYSGLLGHQEKSKYLFFDNRIWNSQGISEPTACQMHAYRFWNSQGIPDSMAWKIHMQAFEISWFDKAQVFLLSGRKFPGNSRFDEGSGRYLWGRGQDSKGPYGGGAQNRWKRTKYDDIQKWHVPKIPGTLFLPKKKSPCGSAHTR